jgi:hypothetical protein
VVKPFWNVATEDPLSEALAVRILAEVAPQFDIGFRLGKKGSGYLKAGMDKFRRLAERAPLLVMTDLDRRACAIELIREWKADAALPEQLVLRVAVRESESWVMADRKALARRMNLSPDLFPRCPDDILDPKEFLLHVARRAKREIRAELVAERGALARQGLGYNRFLSQFVETDWRPMTASQASPSLARAIAQICEVAAA